jgi:hypothetical protein
MVDSQKHFVEYIAAKEETGTGSANAFDVYFDNRYQTAELYIRSTANATMTVKMIPPSLGGVTFTAALLDPPSAVTVTHSGGAVVQESVVFFQSPMSGVRITPSTNDGNITAVVRLTGRSV